ncbi:outer membrane beta-barrel protein [Methylobacterium sp. BE186]|uniref:outer membrane protein n=1 Tax=Methylobacterium sp. BE186 TaxID=2817715 RepID=UPI00286C85E1|nr:porin family protein [Methylobacterium sp. BE186]
MIRKLLFTSAATAALMGAAAAADLPRREAPPPVFTPVPVFTWTGFYAGFNAGYAFDASSRRNGPFIVNLPAGSPLVVGPLAPSQVVFGGRNSLDGFSGGGQIGYNYQFTPGSGAVVGIEADAQYVDFGRNRNRFALTPGFAPAPNIAFVNPVGLASLDFFGTVRGRLGYAWDRTLIYGTGGFAYGSGSDELRFGGFRGNDDFRTGWTAGGGVEYALSADSWLNFFRASAVTFRVEGLYVNLERNNRNNGVFAFNTATGATAVLAPGVIARNNPLEFAVVRAGVNYKFGTY